MIGKVAYEAARSWQIYQRWVADGLVQFRDVEDFKARQLQRIGCGAVVHIIAALIVVEFSRTERLAIGTAIAVAATTLGVDLLFSDMTGPQTPVALYMFYFGLLTLVGIVFLIKNRSVPPA